LFLRKIDVNLGGREEKAREEEKELKGRGENLCEW